MNYPMKRLTACLLALLFTLAFAFGCAPNTGSPDPSDTQQPAIASPSATASAEVSEAGQQEQEKFDQFLYDLFIDTVSSDTLSLHYTLKNPEAYNISLTPTFGDMTPDALLADEAENQQILTDLMAFDRSLLTEKQQLDYDVLLWYLQTLNSTNGYMYYQNLFSQTGGIQANLPITLAEYQFYDEQDVKDYLTLLGQVDTYFQQIETFLKEQSAQGFFPSDMVADTALEQIADFTENPEQNFLIDTFQARIDTLVNLDSAAKEQYVSQNRQLVLETVIPAFTHFGDTISSLKGTGTNAGGVCHYENGQEYYENIVRYQTGTSKSISEIGDALQSRYTWIFQQLSQLMEKNPDIYEQASSIQFTNDDAQAMLQDLIQKTQDDFPAIDHIDYELNYVPEALEDITSPAFYMIPPIDDKTDNTIYINESQTDLSALYPTLAHEGYPGHMYQNNYYNQQNPTPLRTLLSFSGYSEGWATYVEFYSYRWDPSYGGNEEIAQFYTLNLEYSIILQAILDIQINYNGWSLETCKEKMSDIFPEESIEQIYVLVTGEPGYFLKYYLGYLEFVELADYAQSELGSDFVAKEFHQILLDAGPCNFAILREQVDQYIASKK